MLFADIENIPRKSQTVSELCDFTQHRLVEMDGNVEKFFNSLSPEDLKVIEEEVEKVSGIDPACVRYYLENYFIINTSGEEEPPHLQTLYPFNDPQEVLWEDFELCWEQGIPACWILLKARQLGWSTLVQAILAQRTFFNHHIRSLIIADEKVRSNHIFEMARLAYGNMPCWLKPEILYERAGEIFHFDRKDREQRAAQPGLDSIIYVDAANKPSGSSRGFTLHNLHASEVSRYKDMKILTSDILPAFSRGTNKLSIGTIEGTAEGRGYAYHRLWKAACAGKGRFRPVFAAWWLERSYCKPFPSDMDKARFEEAFELTEEEIKIAAKVKDEFGYEIRKDQFAWRREKADEFAALEGDSENVEQEYPSYPEAAWRAKGRTAFDKKKLQQIELRDVRSPIWAGDIQFIQDTNGPRDEKGEVQEIPTFVTYWKVTDDVQLNDSVKMKIKSAPLWIWEWPVAGDIYYGAGDPSMGLPTGDFGALNFFRFPRPNERVRQVAEFQGRVSTKRLAKLSNFLGRFYNTCEFSPETNTLTDYQETLRLTHNYPNIYRWTRPDRDNIMTTFFGWVTNSISRPNLIMRFRTAMIEDALLIRSERLVDECYTFVDEEGDGRFEATGENHDDVLFSAMICYNCLRGLDPTMFDKEGPTPPKVGDFQNTDNLPSEFDQMMDEVTYNNL